MRPLLMDFPQDKKTYEVGDEYLFGRSILVAPVTEYQATSKQTYLPAGGKWWTFWTNELMEGGRTVSVPVTKADLPVFIKAGSILPFGPAVQYSTEKRWDNLEIRIYPGADGCVTLYEDENDNYNYEHGACSLITFKWDDQHRVLTIDDRQGRFKGMLQKRKFNVVLVHENAGVGDLPMTSTQSVTYSGKRKMVMMGR